MSRPNRLLELTAGNVAGWRAGDAAISPGSSAVTNTALPYE